MPRVSGLFFKAMIKAVLVLVEETWVVTSCMGKSLEGVSELGGKTSDGKDSAEENRRDV